MSEQQHYMAAWQAQTRRQTDAEMARREAEARAVLTAKVREAIAEVFYGDVAWCDDIGASAEKAVDVFIDYLRNPPVRETQPDGTETVRWP